jgi:protein involved in polysaccharide export with SLBB domain
MNRRFSAAVLLLAALMPAGARARDLSVTIGGEVERPGAYLLAGGDRLSALIEKAGGYTDNAFLRGAVLLRRSAVPPQGKILEELIARLDKEGGESPQDPGRKREVMASLKKFSPRGRIPVSLTHLRLLKNSGRDIPLEDGDILTVPARPDTVAVIGNVRSPGGAVLPRSGRSDFASCVEAAGGFTERADRSRAYLLKADGTAVSLSRGWIRWNPSQSRWEIPAFASPPEPVEAGDTIVVPEKPDSWARGIEDLPEILLRIAVLTGVPMERP